MVGIDGGTLASQKELKCQINSVRAPDAQEFLYLASWEGDKGRLCVSERAWTERCSVSAPLHVFLLLLLSFERRSGNPPPPPKSPSALASYASPRHRVYRGCLLRHQTGVTSALVFTPAAENAEAAVCVLTGMSAPAEPSYDTLVVNRGADANPLASNSLDNPVFTFQGRAVGAMTLPDLAAVPVSSGC